MMAERIAAQLKIRNAARMSRKKRAELAEWLHDQADSLRLEGEDYAPCYKGTYYEPKERPNGNDER